jgi:Arc/MetJ-type ribon-helix-helix transcriptional regulator
MNIELSSLMSTFLNHGIRDGLFTSVDAAIEEGLELLARQKRLKQAFSVSSENELLTKLDAGLASLDAGSGIPASQAFAALKSQKC